MAETEPLPVLAHFQRLQEDIAINANNGPCGALRGVSAQESLVGTEIPTNFFNISSRDDVDTVVVVGRLADVLRILPNAHLKASHYTRTTIPRASKLEPMYDAATRTVVMRLAAKKLLVSESHVDRWGHSFAMLDIGTRGSLHCFPGVQEADKVDMAIFMMVLWTLLRGSPPNDSAVVIREAIHSPGGSVPIGQVFNELLLQVQQELPRRPLRLLSPEERKFINPIQAYASLQEGDLDRLADALEDRAVVRRILDETLGPGWSEDGGRPYILDFIHKYGMYG